MTPDYNQMIFKATRGGNFEGDIALENVKVQKGKCGIGEDVSFWNEENHVFTESPITIGEGPVEDEDLEEMPNLNLEAKEYLFLLFSPFH